MAINWNNPEPVSAVDWAASRAAQIAKITAQQQRDEDRARTLQEMDNWEATSDEYIGRNVHDGSYYFSHELITSQSRATYQEAKAALDFQVIDRIINGPR